LKSQIKVKEEDESSKEESDKPDEPKPTMSKSQRMALLVIDANVKMLSNLKLISILA